MAAPDGKALLVLGFESADHPVDAWLDRALELARDHGGEARESKAGAEGDSVGAWRNAFVQAPYLRDTFVAGGVISETFETAITWDRWEAFVQAVRERAEARRRGGVRRGARHAAASRTSTRTARRPTSRCSRPAQARRRDRAVGRDQGGGVRRDRGRRRDDHPPPRRRARPPAVVRPSAAGCRSPRRSRAPSARSTPGWNLNPGVLLDAAGRT